MKDMQVSFWRHEPVLDQTALGLAEATLRFHEAVGGDWVKLTPAGTYQATALGLRDEWQGDALGRRAVVHRPVAVPSDWLKLSAAPLGQHEHHNLDAVAWLRKRLPSEVPLVATVFSPVSQALQLAGAEPLVAHARNEREYLEAGLACLSARTEALAKAFFEAGVNGIYYVSQHHQQGVLPEAPLHLLEWTWDEPALKAASKSPFNAVHLHGAPLVKHCPAPPSGMGVHCEWGAEQRRSPIEAVGAIRWLGIPLASLQSAQSTADCRATFKQFEGATPSRACMVTASCVLPLAFDLNKARMWVQALRQST